ncbi:MAG: hypothetical protein IPL55_12170 [Saprospiraceae bacterium]|jgi:hypothetical protein|nr:hypothetical protein [Saprospiraceae bacterium]MBL0024192.1 hypothetical protein [Saprospiraceae bacterium]
MKKFLCITLFTLSSLYLSAQQQYTWEEYGISFTLADDFKESVNSIDEFSASGDGMELSIIPFKDDAIDDSDIHAYTMSIAESLNLERVDDVNTIDINGFKGGYAEGVQNGAKIFVMGLIDPDSETNFFVIITFQDEDQNAIDEAINICKSIKKI